MRTYVVYGANAWRDCGSSATEGVPDRPGRVVSPVVAPDVAHGVREPPGGRGHRRRAVGGQGFGVDTDAEQGAGDRLGGVEQVVQRAAHMLPVDAGEHAIFAQRL